MFASWLTARSERSVGLVRSVCKIISIKLWQVFGGIVVVGKGCSQVVSALV